ncbi:MAG: metallophosphoesterase [Candidatus Woesearchaeota archaeon]
MKLLHFTDIHEDTSKLEKIVNFLDDNKVDVVLNSGDNLYLKLDKENTFGYRFKEHFNNSDMGLVQGKLEEFAKENNIDDYRMVSGLDDKKRKELENLVSNKHEGLEKILNSSYNESVDQLKPYFEKIKENSDHFVGVLGNHDLNLLYDDLGEYMTFLEKEESYNINVNDVDYTFKGLINSQEVPPLMGQIPKNYRIDYLSGVSKEDNKDNKMGYNMLQNYEDQEKKRLNGYDSDIVVSHKIHNHPKDKMGSSDLAKELYEKSDFSSYHSGHFHGAYINFTEDEKFEFNPGTDYVFNIDYNDSKEVESIEIYSYN